MLEITKGKGIFVENKRHKEKYVTIRWK